MVASSLLVLALAAPGAPGVDLPPVEAPPGMGEAVALAPPGVASHLPGVSLLGADALPPRRLGLYGAIGFPYLTAEVLYGAARPVGLYARFDSLYGLLEQVTLGAKWTAIQTPRGDALAFRFEAGYDFFAESEAAENGAPFTARWLSGQRNENVAAALVLSTRYSSGITLFFDGSFELTADTEPLAGPPLSGNPAPFTLGFNTPLHLGLEAPVGRGANLVVTLGADLHFRRVTESLETSKDAIAIPFLTLGFDGLI